LSETTTSVGVRLSKKLLGYIDKEAKRESVDRSVIIRRLVERGAAELEKEKAAKLYIEGKISISGAAETARLTITEMVDYLVCKGYKSDYSIEDFRRGVTLLEKKLKTKGPSS
jgi:metal-responsive CopG/Arc/MetJ family transcriptional regulator